MEVGSFERRREIGSFERVCDAGAERSPSTLPAAMVAVLDDALECLRAIDIANIRAAEPASEVLYRVGRPWRRLRYLTLAG